MSATPAAPAKICVGCNIDVSNAPRMKDPQGRYYCQTCASKAPKAAAPAKNTNAVAAVATASNDVMSKIIAEATAKASHTCPACQHPIPENAAICTGCGLNLASGKRAHTRVERAPKEKETSVKSAGLADNVVYQYFAYSDFGLASLALLPVVLTIPLVFMQKELIAIPVIIFFIAAVVAVIITTIDAFQNSTFHGLAVLISFFVFSGIYMTVYGVFITDSPRVRWLNLAHFVNLGILAATVFLVPGLMDEFRK